MNTAIAKPCGPGRPKDLEKRAAILAAAKQLFPQHGFEGTSMDAIASAAGVSKLTVYSHFSDKETLYVEAIRARCSEQLPDELFEVTTRGPLRQQLESIARAFFTLITTDEAMALHRLLTSGVGGSSKLAQMFWEQGPKLIHAAFEKFLEARSATGELQIDDVQRASSQFFALLKGELHARMLCGCCDPIRQEEIDAHIQATVDFFLRACQPRSIEVRPAA